MKSKSVEGHSVTYLDGDELAPYESAIVAYLEEQEPEPVYKPGVLYFR